MDVRTARRLLGTSKETNKTELKRAYRKLARRHHPDHGGDGATFQRIQQAFELLEPLAPAAPRKPRTVKPKDPIDARLQEIAREVEAQARREARQRAADERKEAAKAKADAAMAEKTEQSDDDSLGALARDLHAQARAQLRKIKDGDLTLTDAARSAADSLKEQLDAGLSKLEQRVADEDTPQTAAERELARVKKLISRYTDDPLRPYDFDERA